MSKSKKRIMLEEQMFIENVELTKKALCNNAANRTHESLDKVSENLFYALNHLNDLAVSEYDKRFKDSLATCSESA